MGQETAENRVSFLHCCPAALQELLANHYITQNEAAERIISSFLSRGSYSQEYGNVAKKVRCGDAVRPTEMVRKASEPVFLSFVYPTRALFRALNTVSVARNPELYTCGRAIDNIPPFPRVSQLDTVNQFFSLKGRGARTTDDASYLPNPTRGQRHSFDLSM